MSSKNENIGSRNLELINDLANGSVSKEEFVGDTDFKVGYGRLKELLYQEQDKVDKENNNLRFRNLLYNLPRKLSRDEEAQLYGELLLEDWHHEHEEIISSFQVLYKNFDESVEVLLRSFKNIPNYISSIPELRQSYQKKIVYALSTQESSLKLEAFDQLLNENIDEVVADLVRRKRDSLS